MAFVVDAFAVADQEDLGRFVTDLEDIGDLIGDGPVTEEVEEVEIDGMGLFGSFQAAFYDGAGGATGTVFEDHLGAGGGSGFDVFELRFGLQRYPIHDL